MKIIVGLGNPGLRYKNTRHNAGFLALKALAKKHGLSIKKRGFNGIYGIGRIIQQEVILFEPLTYMNLSGKAIEAICSSRLEEKEDLLVVSDDFNLSLGQIRLRIKGSSGGHNGLESIIGSIGPEFSRLRIGIGRGEVEGDMTGFVLSPFPRKERPLLKETIERAVEGIEVWLDKGIKEAMNLFN